MLKSRRLCVMLLRRNFDCSGEALGVVFPLCFEAFEAIEHSCQSSKK